MIRKLLFLVFLIIYLTDTQAKLQVQLSYCTFNSPSEGPYIEVYLYFNGDEVKYLKKDGKYYGEVQVNYTFFSADSVKIEKSFIIQSPTSNDTNGIMPNFLNQHKIYLDNGDYDMSISIKDLNSKDAPIETKQRIKILFVIDEMMLSDIEIYKSALPTEKQDMFQKNGFQIIPYTSEIISESIDSFGFYAELYNANKIIGKDSAFLIIYYIEDLNDGQLVPGFRGFTRKNASEVNVIMGKFLVSGLPSGSYRIIIDVMSKDNAKLTSNSISFYKENPTVQKSLVNDVKGTFVEGYTDVDSLANHIAYLQPIAERLEWEFAHNQLLEKDMEMMKKYFLNFWQTRNKLEPDLEWYKYLKQVIICNKNFKTPMRPGYLSDRGFRYLKYGPPNDRYESFDEPLAYPHEVWYYNEVNNQTNRTIIFYNRSQVLNDYEILHSDILGEIYNKDWNLILHRMNPGFYDAENPSYQDYFGDKSRNLMRRN